MPIVQFVFLLKRKREIGIGDREQKSSSIINTAVTR